MKTESEKVAENILWTLIFYTVGWKHMRTAQSKKGVFQKVGECLYRYSSNGTYYARIRVDGKEIKASLETADRKIADRALADFKKKQRQLDRSKGKITLAKLCDQYLETVQHQKTENG